MKLTDLGLAALLAVSLFASRCLSDGPRILSSLENATGPLERRELKQFLGEYYPDYQLPAGKIFAALNHDGDDKLDGDELVAFKDLLEQIDAELDTTPEDPGPGYPLFSSVASGIDDSKVDGAVFHRHFDNLEQHPRPEGFQIESVPMTSRLSLPKTVGRKTVVEDLVKATVVLAGGEGDDYFTSGGVLVRSDGLVLTNFHVAEAFSSGMTALTSDGKSYRVVDFIAGDRLADVALIRIDGTDMPTVEVASTSPEIGDDLVMMHHTENRFYTYDRGYLMRNPVIEGKQWMEVSLPFGPGGSGCGIFNQSHELVGLVSIVMLGDGPSLALLGHGLAEAVDEEKSGESDVEQTDFLDELLWDATSELESDGFELVVRHAVSLPAIRRLFSPVADATPR
ncbi:MAG: serine protease [Rhodopirellula sp. JB044]|uniref:S1 family peptidase n=1 Tax=Rhodopirellula sp. JB044 TaxID=3342844 RepID=UPI00370B6F55